MLAQVLLLERNHQTLPWTKAVTAPVPLPGPMPIRGDNVLGLPEVAVWHVAHHCGSQRVQPSSPSQPLNGLSTIHTTSGMYLPYLQLHPPCPAGLGHHSCQTFTVISLLLEMFYFLKNLLFSFSSVLASHSSWFKVFKLKYASCNLWVVNRGLQGKWEGGEKRKEKKK